MNWGKLKPLWGAIQSCTTRLYSSETIRLAIHGQRYVPDAEPYVWAVAKTMVKALFLAGHSTVILDVTNNTADRRKMWLSSKWVTRFKHIDTSKDECLKRATGDNEIIPVIERMAEQFEPLTEKEEAYEGE